MATKSDNQIEQYLEGIDFPVRQKEMLRKARNNDAPEEVLDRLRAMDEGTYESMDEVRKALDKAK